MPQCIVCSIGMSLRFGKRVPSHWVCTQCGLECISPQPDDRTLTEVYDASYFVHYKNGVDPQVVRAMKRATYGRQLRRLSSMQSDQGERRLLDCGAATGFLCELAREWGWNAFALEISTFGASACAQLLGPDHVYQGEAQRAVFPANTEAHFEAITMFDYIEHVRDPLQVLEWAKTRLVSGGSLLLTTPRTGSLSWRLMGQHWFHYKSGEHLWFFTPASMKGLLNKIGFTAIEIRSLPKALTVGYVLAYYQRKTSYNRALSPVSTVLESILSDRAKRQRVWAYLGEMAILARS
jgi:SAM-dependent methyltransferase